MRLTTRQLSSLFADDVAALGWKDFSVAEHVGVSPATMTKWLNPNDPSEPNATAIVAVAKLTGRFQTLDVLNQAAGRVDDAARLRRDLTSIEASAAQALRGEQ